ncbi:MAG: hypothetical protein KJ593_00575 [Candidatus Omnitrophica bacterium]|nr:hypothetical protein [Candidatus Omnitrophota bacterium]
MKKRIIRIVVAILIGLAVFSFWNYLSLFRMTKQLAADLAKAHTAISQLKVDLDGEIVSNRRLVQEKIILERGFVFAKEEITRSKQAIEGLEQDISGLKVHADALEKDNETLRSRINRLAVAGKRLIVKAKELIQEKEDLQMRLNSVTELKKVIKRLKDNPSEELQSQSKEGDDSSGNKGYLIKRGKSTHKSSIDIRVLPVP